MQLRNLISLIKYIKEWERGFQSDPQLSQTSVAAHCSNSFGYSTYRQKQGVHF